MAGRGSVVIDFNANVARFTSSVDKMSNDLSKFQTNAARVSKNIDKSFSSIAFGIKGAFGGIAAALSVNELATMADSFQNIQARLKLATRDANEFAEANDNIKRIAASAKAPLESTATLYTRISQSLLDVGGSQAQVAAVTQALALALRLSGATAAESSSAMLQFSQAIGSGVLRGEEFNAVNEAAPRAMKALADALQVPVGKLREMAQEGKITRDILVEALGSQLPKLIKEAETLPNTIGAAFQDLKNQALLAVGEIDKITGASTKAAEAIGLISKGITGWKNFITKTDEQRIDASLESIRFQMDQILLQRKALGSIGINASSFRSDALQKLNAEALALQKNLAKIQETTKEPVVDDGSAAAKRLQDAIAEAEAKKKREEAAKAAEKAAKALASQQKTFLEGLEKEASLLGATTVQQKLYEAGILKITGAKLAGVKANAETIENYKREQDVLETMRNDYAEAADAYLKFIQTTQADVKSATEKVERMKVELGLMGKTEAQRDKLLAQYDLEIKYQEKLKQLNGLDTGDAVKRIQEESLARAKASEEEVIKFQEALDVQKKNAAEMQKVWDNFGFNVQRNLGDQIYNVLTGNFQSIGQAWRSMLARMIADAAAAQISKSLFNIDTLKSGLGILSSIFGGFGGGKSAGGLKLGSSNFGQFLWPTFATGGDFGGGMRLVGERGPELEVTGPSRIFNANQTKDILSGGKKGVSVNYAPVIQIDSRADRTEVHAIVSRAIKQGNADLIDRLERGGRI